jgi:hypothetical protein
MYENCTVKYIKDLITDVNCAVRITYPAVDGISLTLDVPMSENNTDYQNILKWVAEGNTIQEDD